MSTLWKRAFASLASTNALTDEKNLAHVSQCKTRPVTSSRSVDAESHKGEVQRLRRSARREGGVGPDEEGKKRTDEGIQPVGRTESARAHQSRERIPGDVTADAN